MTSIVHTRFWIILITWIPSKTIHFDSRLIWTYFQTFLEVTENQHDNHTTISICCLAEANDFEQTSPL